MNVMKILAALAVVLCICAVIVFVVLPKFEQTAWVTDKAIEYKNIVIDYVQQNLALVMGSVGTIVTIGGAAASKVSAAKNQLTQVTDSAKNQLKTLTDEKDALTKQFTDQKTGYESQITNLKKQLEGNISADQASELTNKLNTAQQNYDNILKQKTFMQAELDKKEKQISDLQSKLSVLLPPIK